MGELTTKQIYTIVNSLAQQATGHKEVIATDTQSLIAVGDLLYTNNATVETFLNTLMGMIFEDLIVSRAYQSPLEPLVLGKVDYGVVLRKMSTDMLDFEEEQSVDLYQKQGQSIDQYKINLPVARQWLFASRTPKQLKLTIQKVWIKEAFTSSDKMGQFISDIFMKIRNRQTQGVETETRATIINMAARTKQKLPNAILPLVSIYNEMNIDNPDFKEVPTGQASLFDDGFLRWLTGYVRELGATLAGITNKYNIEKLDRFTPVNEQRVLLLSRFKTQLQTTALYSAFNDEYLKLVKHIEIPYWQGIGNASTVPNFEDIAVMKSTQDGNDVIVENVIGIIQDKFAAGVYTKLTESAVTPLNAAGLYVNHFFHTNQMNVNCDDEQFVVLTLN